MKKVLPKKLSLSKETLRPLTENDLGNALGGGLTLGDSSSGGGYTYSCKWC
jgi:hypothetical protein